MPIISVLQSVASPWLDAVALALTHGGSEQAYVALLLVAYLAVDARAGRLLGMSVLISYYLNQQAKAWFDTARPFVDDPALLRSEAARLTAPGAAFPSGHVQSATTFWGLVAALVRRRWVTWACASVITVMAATRLYLGLHWPIDVLGGVLLGLAVVAAALALARWRPRLGLPLRMAGWVAGPLAVHLVWPTTDSGLIAGALAGFATGPEVVRYRPTGSAWRRAGIAALGLALVFAWLLGTSVALPEAAKDHALVAPLRYFVLAWMGVVAAPWLAMRLGWMPRPRPA